MIKIKRNCIIQQRTMRASRTKNREHNFEDSGIQCSVVELNARNDFHSVDNILKWINVGFDLDGYPIICGGQIKISPNCPYIYSAPDIITFPFNLQPSCEPRISRYTAHGPQIINGSQMLNAKFLMLRLMSLIDYSGQNLPDDAYESYNQADKYYAAYLGSQMDMPGVWDSKITQNNGPWIRTQSFHIPASDINSYYLPVTDVSGMVLFLIKVIVFRDSMSYSVLPVAHYKHPNYNRLLELLIPPKPPYHLVGIHFLKDFPEADIYLTDDFILYISNPPSSERIFLFNPGGNAWIDELYIENLKKRIVVLPVWEDDKKSFQTAVALTQKLYSTGITPYYGLLKLTPCISHSPNIIPAQPLLNPVIPHQNLFPVISPEEFLMGEADLKYKVIDIRDFLKLAESLVDIPDEINLGRNGAIDLEEFEASVPLIENIAESRAITAIVEHRGVEPNIISGLLMSSLQNNENKFAVHLNNLCGETLRGIIFIDAEHQARYMRHIKALPNNFNPTPNSGPLLYKANFLDEPPEDGFITFKNALLESLAQVVIFDVESICEANHRKLSLLKKVFRHCKEKDIAVILILRNGKILQYFSSPDRLVHIWKKAGDKFNYIVEPEARLGEKEIKPFEINITTDKCITKSLKPEILGKIPERENRNKQPGVAPAMEAFLEKLGPQNIKDMPLS